MAYPKRKEELAYADSLETSSLCVSFSGSPKLCLSISWTTPFPFGAYHAGGPLRSHTEGDSPFLECFHPILAVGELELQLLHKMILQS